MSLFKTVADGITAEEFPLCLLLGVQVQFPSDLGRNSSGCSTNKMQENIAFSCQNNFLMNLLGLKCTKILALCL